MNVRDFLGKAEDIKEKVEHGNWLTSSRFLLALAFMAFVAYVTKGILTDTLYICLSVVVTTYLITNSWTKNTAMKVNGEVIKERQKLAWQDGKITKEEAEMFKDKQPPATL